MVTVTRRQRFKKQAAAVRMNRFIARGSSTDEVERALDKFDRLNRSPQRRLHDSLLTYFCLHDTGTIQELLDYVCPRMEWRIGWTGERASYAKQIERARDALGFKIAKSPPGPKPKR
jgi:hypothetical protein